MLQFRKATENTEAVDARRQRQEVVKHLFKRGGNCEMFKDNCAWGKKHCRCCNKDYEAAYTDAKRQGEFKFFLISQKFQKISENILKS